MNFKISCSCSLSCGRGKSKSPIENDVSEQNRSSPRWPGHCVVLLGF